MKTKKAKILQSDKFVSKARELDCDEDETAFDDKLRRLTQPKPEKDKGSGQVI